MNAKWKICVCLSICVFLGTKGNYSNLVNYLHVLRSVTSKFWRFVSLWPWRRVCQPTSVFLPGETHGQRSLAGCSPWSREELAMTERLSSSRSLLFCVKSMNTFKSYLFFKSILVIGFPNLENNSWHFSSLLVGISNEII